MYLLYLSAISALLMKEFVKIKIRGSNITTANIINIKYVKRLVFFIID